MCGSCVTTFEVGNSPVADVESDVEALTKEYGDDNTSMPIGMYRGNVTWLSRERNTVDVPPPDIIASPQVIGTISGDTGHSGRSTLYRVEDGAYHEVDAFSGFWLDLNKLSDYFLINYGTAPLFAGSGRCEPLPDDDNRLPEIYALSDERPDWWLDPSGHGLDSLRRDVDTGVAVTEGFVETVLDADAVTQRLVAPNLWRPLELPGTPYPRQADITELVRLVNADSPELRAAGIHGAGVVLGEIVVAIKDGDSIDGTVLGYETIAPAVDSFYDAFATALTDSHPLVRGRAAGMAVEPLAGAFEDTVAFIGEEPLWNCLSEPVHYRASEAIRAAGDDDVEAVAKRMSDFLNFSEWTDNLAS